MPSHLSHQRKDKKCMLCVDSHCSSPAKLWWSLLLHLPHEIILRMPHKRHFAYLQNISDNPVQLLHCNPIDYSDCNSRILNMLTQKKVPFRSVGQVSVHRVVVLGTICECYSVISDSQLCVWTGPLRSIVHKMHVWPLRNHIPICKSSHFSHLFIWAKSSKQFTSMNNCVN